MEIYVIRHTAPVVPPGVCYGQSDVKLSSSFPREAEAVKNRLQSLGWSPLYPVFSSPLERCIALARFLSNRRIITDERLLELHFGAWEMKKWEEIPKIQLEKWGKDYVRQAPPGGESYRMLVARVGDFMEDLRNNPAPSATLVTHAGVIRAIHVWSGITGWEESFNMPVDYGQVFKFEI